MDLDRFWALIDSTRDQPDRAELLATHLREHSLDEMIQFRILYDDQMNRANLVDLWGAANTINGHCNDEDFFYFREGLIELGRDVFEAALRSPDSLVDVASPGVALVGTEGLGNSAAMAWAAKSVQSEEAFYEAVDSVDVNADRGAPEEGIWWNFDDIEEVRHRLPRLAAKFATASEE